MGVKIQMIRLYQQGKFNGISSLELWLGYLFSILHKDPIELQLQVPEKIAEFGCDSGTKPYWDKYKIYSNASSSKKSWNKLWVTTTEMNPVYKSEQLKQEF